MTADTYSNTLGFLIQGVGNNNNLWGGLASSNVFQILEDAIANVLTSSVTGGTLDLSASPPPAAASQVRYAGLKFTGTLTADQVVVVPNLSKFWLVRDNTSGAFTLKLRTPSGSLSDAIPRGAGWLLLACDGANAVDLVLPLPRMSTAQRDLIISPPVGMQIFNTTTLRPNYWNGSIWLTAA